MIVHIDVISENNYILINNKELIRIEIINLQENEIYIGLKVNGETFIIYNDYKDEKMTFIVYIFYVGLNYVYSFVDSQVFSCIIILKISNVIDI